MKKFLSLLLAILMVLSLAANIVISAGAEEAQDANPIVVPIDSDKWVEGALKENIEGQAKVRYRGFEGGSSHNAGGFMFCYGEGNTVAPTDISGKKYFIFDVYVTNVNDLAEVEFSFELTSSGTADQQESAKKFFGKDTGWTNGWNHVVWELSEFNVKNGEFDPTKWNYIRWYNDGTLKVGTEKLRVYITNIMFATTDVSAPKAEPNAEFIKLGDEFLADFNLYGQTTAAKESFQGDSSAPVKVALANADMLAKWNWLWVYMLDHLKATNPDATSEYVTDAYAVLEKMIAGDTTAILDNANSRTAIRSYIHGFLNAMKGCGDLNADFSKFSPDFSSVEEQNKLVAASKSDFEKLGDEFLADFNLYGQTTAAKESFQGDSSAPVKVALANADMLAKWNWLWVYMLDHLKATNPDATSGYVTDSYAVLEKMIAGDTTAILDNANARTAIRSYIHGFLNAMKGCGDLNADFSKFSPDFSSVEEQNKLAEAWKANANQPETPKLEGLLIPMDEGWSESWTEENFHEKLSQVRLYGNTGSYNPGGFMFRYNAGGNQADPVDITKYAYIEFDVYVSDVNVIADVLFSFELTSAGDSDQEESARNFAGKDTGWVNGWNHVKWSLDEFNVTNGTFDPTRWNYIRWYNDSVMKLDAYFEVGIANLRFTKRAAEELDAEEATKTEHSVPLWGCNTGWDVAGELWTVDKENQVAGSAAISINLKNRVDVMAPEKHFDTPIDATGMDTLEFDIYLSDLAIVEYFSNTDGALELTSGGTSDQAEVSYNLRNFTKYVLSDAKVGWNHVTIKIKNMETNDGEAGAFDISKINFIRFYWVNPPACEQDWILKLDNFRLTDKAAQDEANEAQQADKILETLTDFLAEIDALQSIADATLTAETYAAAKAQYDAVKAKYDALTDVQKNALSEKGYSLKMSNAYKPIKAYEEYLAEMEELADIINALKALEAYANASAFTAENYDAAKKQIQDARKAYEDLVRSDKKFLEDNGFLAYLTAAEAAMPAEKPAAPTTGDGDTTDDGEQGGCQSSLTIGAVATMILAGAWVAIAARKKED